MKILCVDDSALIRKIVSRTVEVMGYACLEAGNGQEALKVLDENPGQIGLITLDWHMPEMDGYEFLQIVKVRFKEIPVLMLTSESKKDSIVKAIKAGVDNYLLKPFSQEDLLVRINECLGEAGSEQGV